MTPVQIDHLLGPATQAPPAGPCIEYDNEALALESLLARRDEQQWGELVVPAVTPDWWAVRRAAEALLLRSKDLRFATAWLRAGLHTAGWPGLEAGLLLVEQLMRLHGAALHPQPDPDDGDLTLRRSAVLALVDPHWLGELRAFRIDSEAAMRWRDVELACRPELGVTGEEFVDPRGVLQAAQGLAEREPRVFALWHAMHAAASRIGTLASEGWGAHRDDLEPLLQLTAALDAAGRASRGGSHLLLHPVGDPLRVESAVEAVAEIDRISEWLARTCHDHPAALLLARVRRLLDGRRFADAVLLERNLRMSQANDMRHLSAPGRYSE